MVRLARLRLHVVAASAVQACLHDCWPSDRVSRGKHLTRLHAQLTRRYHQNQLGRQNRQFYYIASSKIGGGECAMMRHRLISLTSRWALMHVVGFQAEQSAGQGRLQLPRACTMSKQLASGACSEGLAKVGAELGRQRLLPVVDGRQAAVEEAQDLQRWIGGPYSTARLQQRAFAPSVAACNGQCSPRPRR